MNRIKFLIFVFVALSFRIYSQNTMSVADVSGNANDTLEINLNISNSDTFVAFQTDIQLPAQVQYINNSAQLTSRVDKLTLSASLLQNNVLRLIAYSLSQSQASGNSGSVLKFKVKLGTKSGNFDISFINPVISNSYSQNILSSSLNGRLTIFSPEINMDQSSLDFSATPLTQSAYRNVTIRNTGNKTLSIKKMYTDNSYFELQGGTSIDILPYSSTSVSIKFNSVVKGTYSSKLFIESNASETPQVKVSLSAVAFAVNELHVMSASGRSGSPVDVIIKINNMEAFTGFQFDLNLPNIMSYIPNSAQLTSRKGDHTVSANMISGSKLRVIAFSASNQSFTGNDGDVVKLSFNINGTGGYYYPSLENVIITDNSGTNILSASTSNYINIVSPDISAETNINMGEVSVTETATYNYTINNYGNDTLVVSSFSAPLGYFWNATPLPVKIAPWQNAVFQLKFRNQQKGSYSDRFAIRSNDPDEDPFYVNISASSFVPNYMSIENINISAGDTVTIKMDVSNYDTDVVALQADIEVPSSLTYVNGSAALSSLRKQDHLISAAKIADNKLRVIIFSMNQMPFKGNSGAVAEFKFTAANQPGTYSVKLSQASLSNSLSQNVLKSASDGQVQITPPLVKANLRVFLQGAYNGGVMSTALKDGGYLPLSQPYNTAPLNYAGNESVAALPSGVVDWVLVELRSGITSDTWVASKAGFLKSDGSVVDIDGSNQLAFQGVSSGSYYIVVRHRNHMAVMSSRAAALGSTSALYDFTSSASMAYGANAMKSLNSDNSVWGMYTGKATAQTVTVGFMDRTAVRNINGFSAMNGYGLPDLNLDGKLNYIDRTLVRANTGVSSKVP